MWQAEFVMGTKSKKEKIWSLWTDVRNWHKWDTHIEYSYLNGDFKDGVYGSYKTFDGTKSIYEVFELRDCVFQKAFTYRLKLPLCIMDFGHELTEGENKIIIRHYIKICGILEFMYKKSIGVRLAKNLEKTVKKLIKTAEAFSKPV